MGYTEFVQVLPDKYKSADAVEAYRNYYRYDKVHFRTYKYTDMPKWLQCS